MKRVLVLGSGQLGLMMAEAAARLGVELDRLDLGSRELIQGSSPQRHALSSDWNANHYDIVTVELEHFTNRTLLDEISKHPGFWAGKALNELADRRKQKALLDRLEIDTSEWSVIHKPEDISRFQQKAGARLVVKVARGGYDGRGQWRIELEDPELPPADLMGQLIAERMVNFDREVSLIGARDPDGNCVFYPLVENHHVDGMLRYTVAPAQVPPSMQSAAEDMLSRIMKDLDYVGVMAMECFDESGHLLVNELAPRVHNSGHWSQDGAAVDQFELHLRALCGMPMGSTKAQGVTAMLNLVGQPFESAWLGHDEVRMHWYGKGVRPGRKLGHVNIQAVNARELSGCLERINHSALAEHLPEFEAAQAMVNHLIQAQSRPENPPV